MDLLVHAPFLIQIAVVCAAWPYSVSGDRHRVPVATHMACILQAENDAHADTATKQSDKLNKYLRETFDKIDVDGSGDIDRAEFSELARHLGCSLTSSELDVAMRQMDTSGDGSVDFDEFATWWQIREKEKKSDDKSVFGSFFNKFRAWGDSEDEDSDEELPSVLPEYMVHRFTEIAIKKSPENLEVLANLKLFETHKSACEIDQHRPKGVARIGNLFIESLRCAGCSRVWREHKVVLQHRRLEWYPKEATPGERWTSGERRGFVAMEEIASARTQAELDAEQGVVMMAEDSHRIVVVEYRRKHSSHVIRLRADTAVEATGWERIIQQLSSINRNSNRTGKQLWDFLRPRLKLVVAAQEAWGDVHHMYSKGTSNYIEVFVPPNLRDPDSCFSTVWDLLQVLMLVYVAATVPLRICFDDSVGIWTTAFFVDMVVDVYFIFDLVLNFRTAYWSEGSLVIDTVEIRSSYMRGWFFIDFFSCLPLQYVGYVMPQDESEEEGAEGSGGSLRALKILRMVRMGKMLRLARVGRILQKYENAMAVAPFLKLGFTVCTILFSAHVLACLWYVCGSSDQVLDSGNVIGGWVMQMEAWVRRSFA